MNYLLDAAATTAGAADQAPMGGSLWILLIYVVILGGAFYFFAIRPQKKQQKQQQALLDSVEIGDSVVTTGGFYGVVIDIMEDVVIVEFGNNKNCRIPMKKAAIVEVGKQESDEPEETK